MPAAIDAHVSHTKVQGLKWVLTVRTIKKHLVYLHFACPGNPVSRSLPFLDFRWHPHALRNKAVNIVLKVWTRTVQKGGNQVFQYGRQARIFKRLPANSSVLKRKYQSIRLHSTKVSEQHFYNAGIWICVCVCVDLLHEILTLASRFQWKNDLKQA